MFEQLIKSEVAKAGKKENYTVEQAESLKARYLAGEPMEDIAKDMGRTVRSLVAKASREGYYVKKTYHRKDGEPVAKKNEHAEAIGAILKLPENDVTSLSKCNRSALVAIFSALANSKPIN